MKDSLSLLIHVAPVCAFLLIAMACNASPSGVKPPPQAELARLAEQGRLEGVTIEYWVGGGPPPPYYRSDQFRLLTVENRDTIEFARPYHDPAAKLEGLVEKLQLPAQPSEVRGLAKLILDTGVFERQFPEEKDPGQADSLATEVIVSIGGREFKRRYFTASPKPLEPLRAEVERLVQRLTASGTRQVLSQGKPIDETVPLSRLPEEVGRRIDRLLSAKGRLVLWLQVSETDPARAAARDVKRVLEAKPGLVFSTRSVTGATPVPSGTPGGHVHMLIYAIDPHPDVVLAVDELNGRMCVSERDAGKDPLEPIASWNWTLCVR
ncbi:MAG: hypothetical protein ABSE56_13100 [Bryobacteraceae bacterium]|jgi:hypothetical protein